MTTKEAISTIQRILMETVDKLKEQDAVVFANALDEAWKIVREAALKAENRPSDERTTAKGMFIPESPNDDEMSDFKKNVDMSLNEFNKELMRCETDIEMLWNAVEQIKEKLPKEWRTNR